MLKTNSSLCIINWKCSFCIFPLQCDSELHCKIKKNADIPDISKNENQLLVSYAPFIFTNETL